MGWGQWVGHLPGNQEDLSPARITQEMGGVLPDATLGGPGLCPLPQTDSALPPCLASFQLPTRDLSSSRSELSSAPSRRGVPPLHVCAPDFQLRSHVRVAALCSHACARATRVCSTRCQPSTESGWPPLAPCVDEWVCFSLHVLGSEKKNPQMSSPRGAFPFIFFLPRCL